MATSIKLSSELRERVASVAKARGTSPQANMLEAISARTEQEEHRQEFVKAALASRDEAIASGKVFDADEVHAYLKARVRGEKVARPKAKQWRR